MKRIVGLLVILAIVAAAAFGGWLAGSRIKSPEQAASEIEPPEPSLITVPVESMVISTDVITRGSVRFDQPESVTFDGVVAVKGLAPIVTMAPQQGAEYNEGDVLYEVAGRPVFILQGDIPLFRDLSLGAEGQDVLQFQQALARLGFDPGEQDGLYGTETEQAAKTLYEAAGYDAIGASDLEEANLEAAQDAERLARKTFDRALAARDGAASAERRADSLESDLNAARSRQSTAETRLATAQAGTHPDTGLPPTATEMAAFQAAVSDALAEVGELQADLAQAEGEASVLSSLEDALTDATDQLSDAVFALDELESQIGFKVPRSEVAFFEAFPIRVDTVNISRGDTATGEVMRVTGSRLAIDSSVDVELADPISEGDPVLIDLTSRGISLTGVVSRKADRPGTDGVDGQDVYIEIVPDEVRPDLNEANVRITIPVESTAGEVLAVPAAALSASADGTARVEVEFAEGQTRFVTVATGLSARGMVEVSPVDGELAAGDRVVIGTA